MRTMLPFTQMKWYYFSGLPVFLLVLACIGFAPALFAQNEEDNAAAEILENFFRDNEQASESDVQLFLENLQNLRNNPINLNAADKDALAATGLLNVLQIEQLLNYREKVGPLLNVYELQGVPSWNVEDIKRILPYIRVGEASLDQRNVNLWRGFREGENELLLRWGRPDPFSLAGKTEGQGNALAFRYKHSFDNRMRFGFTLENDPGEALFRGSNKLGSDFYSAHLFIQNLNSTVKALALGDYSARFGQGLLLQTGFASGKSAETASVARSGRKINGYNAFGEVFFFRGAAATLAFGEHWEMTALLSSRNRDGNVVTTDSVDLEAPEVVFTSLQTSGLHRTNSEIEDEKSLQENVGGINLTYKNKQGSIGLNALHISYDRPWDPSSAAYRNLVFRGKDLTSFSADYNWRYRNWLLFGETARSENGAVASVNGLLLSPDQHVTLSIVHRALPADYWSIYALPFAESSGAANENGLFLGADIRWIRRWQINLYADVWRHPWLRFGVDGPSSGREFLARVIWTKSKVFSAYALWQLEGKERTGAGEVGLEDNVRNRLRLHATYKMSAALELRSRIEWTTVTIDQGTASRGFLAFQEAVFKPLGYPISGAFRYAVYDTENFDTRVFAFENDLFAAVSIPGFSGRGSRYYFNLSWRINDWLRLEGRYEETIQNKAVTTTGLTGKDRFFKLQARAKF